MNKYLKLFFEQILPAIEHARIKYWVYGGVAYASMVGKFYRRDPNLDLDIFVLDNDFENIEKILIDKCIEYKWKIRKSCIHSGRPKLEVLIDGKERLSVIPVYKNNDVVEFKFHEGSKKFTLDILKQVERLIGGFRFYTPQDNFIKDLFIDYLECKKKYPKKRIEDARYILLEEEFKKYFPKESYEKS